MIDIFRVEMALPLKVIRGSSMNIKKYMKAHESHIREMILKDLSKQKRHDLKEKHTRMITYMQHEWLVHLMVTLAIGAFLLITLAILLIKPTLEIVILMGLFLILLVFYVMHYFFLENTIQRWYRLMDEIEEKSIRPGD